MAPLKILAFPHVDRGQSAPAGYSLSPCADCAAPCCATLRARLTTVEAHRIAAALQVPFQDVAEPVPGAEHHHPWFTVPVPLCTGPVTLALRRGPGTRCTFLHDVGTRGRCSIHALRPGICRLYPYPVMEDGVRTDVRGTELCPTAWAVDADVLAAVRRDMRAWRESLARETALVARFRKLPAARRTWEKWVEFTRG